MKYPIFGVGLAFCLSLMASEPAKLLNDFDPLTDVISEDLEAGPYLIYDCVENRWACVREVHFNECKEKRKIHTGDLDRRYRCSPIGSFSGKKSCFQRQAFLVSQAVGDRSCNRPRIEKQTVTLRR